jgi:malate dehydrogenase (oxaloacetate-decarboxylating)
LKLVGGAGRVAVELHGLEPVGHQMVVPVTALRDVAFAVALATAFEAHKQGLTQGVETDQIEAAIRAKIWQPRYLRYQRAISLAG